MLRQTLLPDKCSRGETLADCEYGLTLGAVQCKASSMALFLKFIDREDAGEDTATTRCLSCQQFDCTCSHTLRIHWELKNFAYCNEQLFPCACTFGACSVSLRFSSQTETLLHPPNETCGSYPQRLAAAFPTLQIYRIYNLDTHLLPERNMMVAH